MKSALSLTILSSLLPLALSNCQPKPLTIAATPSPSKLTIESSTPSLNPSLSKSSNALALDAYTQLAQANEGQNLFFSPLSISSALWMTYSGARAETAKEMSQALHLTQAAAQLESQYNAYIRALENDAKQGKHAPKLNIANGLCVLLPVVNKDYRKLLKTQYQAEIFAGDVQKINAWVSQKTEQKIPQLIKTLDPNSAAVILNAIYFKGSWASKFQAKNTKDKPFHGTNGKQKMPMMSQENNFRLLENKDFRLISLPYQDSSLSLQILLPNQGKSLAQIEKTINLEKLKSWQEQVNKQRFEPVNLELPKLKLESEYELSPSLQNLGIKKAFNPNQADFSGIGGKPQDLWIKKVLHKAVLELDEKGTEAAAATAVVLQYRGPIKPVTPNTFHANRPFLFWIQEDQSGTLLFLGRYLKPEKN